MFSAISGFKMFQDLSYSLKNFKGDSSVTELLGFWTFSIVWYSREHDVLETGSVSVLR
jgi:hypothetical protein